MANKFLFLVVFIATIVLLIGLFNNGYPYLSLLGLIVLIYFILKGSKTILNKFKSKKEL